MKKAIFIILFVTLSAVSFSHEVTANLYVEDDGPLGLDFLKGNLWWGDGNYLVDLNFFYGNNQELDFNFSQAWKKVNLWDFADFTIGRQPYSFGNVLSSKGSNNLQIQPIQIAPYEWMFKLHKDMGKINLYVDGVWPKNGVADLNGRLAYESANFTLGGAVIAEEFGKYFHDTDDNDLEIAWEGDIKFILANFLKLKAQVTNLKYSDEINYYFIASYAPGFELPYMGKKVGRLIYGEWRPYVGMITRDDADGKGMGESNIFGGLNYQSYEKSYMKFEVNIDSDDNVDPTFIVQMGYRF
jgi:hypothetical protein